jgi:hypothetical protein
MTKKTYMIQKEITEYREHSDDVKRVKIQIINTIDNKNLNHRSIAVVKHLKIHNLLVIHDIYYN